MKDVVEGLIQKVNANIERVGWSIYGVGGSPLEEGGYSYTIGMSDTLGHPEIFVVGFHPELASSLLNIAGQCIRDGHDFRRPALCDRIIQKFNVAFRPVHPESAIRYGGLGRRVLGRDFEAVQMFLPDESGLFPWDEGCADEFAELQTVLLNTYGPRPGSEEYRRTLI